MSNPNLALRLARLEAKLLPYLPFEIVVEFVAPDKTVVDTLVIRAGGKGRQFPADLASNAESKPSGG